MKIFVSTIYPEHIIICPFLGIEWDGTYDNLSAILKNITVKDGKVLPFKISVLETNKELIFNHKVTHPNASKEDVFFLFDNKELIKSANKLSGLFELTPALN